MRGPAVPQPTAFATDTHTHTYRGIVYDRTYENKKPTSFSNTTVVLLIEILDICAQPRKISVKKEQAAKEGERQREREKNVCNVSADEKAR